MYERKEEFKRLIDMDNNGKANRSELLSYVDPRHPRHALTESANLFELADENNDKKLTLEEVEFKLFFEPQPSNQLTLYISV